VTQSEINPPSASVLTFLPLGGLRDSESLRDVIPIDDLPDVVDVVRAHVLVLEVVSVFPYIDPQQGNQTGGSLERVLVGAGSDHQAVVWLVITQPSPARPLNTNGSGRHGLLESFKGPKLCFDHVVEVTVRHLTAASPNRRQVLPKDGMIQMTATYPKINEGQPTRRENR
jgi:hypothetical protein